MDRSKTSGAMNDSACLDGCAYGKYPIKNKKSDTRVHGALLTFFPYKSVPKSEAQAIVYLLTERLSSREKPHIRSSSPACAGLRKREREAERNSQNRTLSVLLRLRIPLLLRLLLLLLRPVLRLRSLLLRLRLRRRRLRLRPRRLRRCRTDRRLRQPHLLRRR